MSKRDYCIHFVDISHLTASERREAAYWAYEQFGPECVDIFNPKAEPVDRRYKHGLMKEIPGFWFAHKKDVTMFLLKWSR